MAPVLCWHFSSNSKAAETLLLEHFDFCLNKLENKAYHFDVACALLQLVRSMRRPVGSSRQLEVCVGQIRLWVTHVAARCSAPMG